jgi:hypothetical protein
VQVQDSTTKIQRLEIADEQNFQIPQKQTHPGKVAAKAVQAIKEVE